VARGSIEWLLRDAGRRWRDVIEAGSSLERSLNADAASLRDLAPEGSATETELLAATTAAVVNYFAIERPWNFDPVGRELHVEATSGGVPLHGFIDRLDSYVTGDGEERWVISDYKTGKLPRDRYLDEAFFAMKIYALLVAETKGIIPHSLRLIFVAADAQDAVRSMKVDDALLGSTRSKLQRIWQQIAEAYEDDIWMTTTGPLCNWCHFQPICPAFGASGSPPPPAPRDG